MIRSLVAALLLTPSLADAGDFVTDAFGIVPANELSETRATWSGLQERGDRQHRVTPSEPLTVLVLVGPKSLVAGKDEGHAVALVLDTYGNAVADDLSAAFTLDESQPRTASTNNGIADVRFSPTPLARTLSVGAEIGRVQSPRALVQVTADLGSVLPTIAPPEGQIPVETLTTLTTGPLSDRFGNPVEDGVLTNWTLRHEDGRWTVLTATTLNQTAEATLLTRDISTGAAATAALAGKVSAAAPIAIKSARAAFGPEMQIWGAEGLEAVWLRVGPVTTDAGYLLTDGANLAVDLRTASDRVIHRAGWLRDGYFQTMFPVASDEGPFTVRVETILGTEVRQVSPGKAPTDLRGVE